MVSPPCAKLLASPDLAALGSAFSCCDASVSTAASAAPVAAAPTLNPAVAPILVNGTTKPSPSFILVPSASPSAGEDTPPLLSCGRPDSITIRQAQAITALPASLASVAGLDVLEVHGTLRGHVDVSGFDTLRRLVLSNSVDLVLDPGKSKSPFSSSPNLRELDLSNNGIEGEFPKGVLGKGQLQLLNLSNNHLVGHIPESLVSSLPRLRMLDLAQNQLTGPVPSLRALTSLQSLYLANNQLTNLHPDTLPDTLQDLNVAHNQLTDILALETWATTLKSVSVYDNPQLAVRLGDVVFKDLTSLDLRKVKAVHFGVRAAVPFPQPPGFTCQIDPATACIRSAGADVVAVSPVSSSSSPSGSTRAPDADAAASPTRRLVAGTGGPDPLGNAADVIYLWKLCNVAKRCVAVDPAGLDSDLATASGDDPGADLPTAAGNSGGTAVAGPWAVILTATVSVLFAVVVLLVMHILRQNRRTRRIKVKLDRATAMHRTEFAMDPPPPILSGAAPTVVAPLDSDSEPELASPTNLHAGVAYDVLTAPPPAVVRAWAMYPQPRPPSAVAAEEVALRAIPSAVPRGDLLSPTAAVPMGWPTTTGANGGGGKVHPLIAGFQPSMGSVSTAVLSSSPVTESAPPPPPPLFPSSSAWMSRAPSPPPVPAVTEKIHPLIAGWHPSSATVATVVLPPPPSSPTTDVPPVPSTSPWTSRAPTSPPSTPTAPPAAADPDDETAAAMAAWPYLHQTGWGEFMAVAVYPHTPTMRDEIALIPGDTVWVEVAPEDEYAPPPGVPFMGGAAGAGWGGMPWAGGPVEGGSGRPPVPPPWAVMLDAVQQPPPSPPVPPTSPVGLVPPPPSPAAPMPPILWPPFPPPPVPDVKILYPDSDKDENHFTLHADVSGASSSSATLTNGATLRPKHVRQAAAAREEEEEE
ncbi:hypothetical protein AMAG_03952 [Allomyces macrogynus ATCC 38327]|uniref:Uncharacterized protein n=1 Tax=Allomyces macrogynus (strain ATCC 38327) TaxID=578462 RepID=A0A0L0S7N4_ALLM3|nr:hypothetical protein AMAG_03952 [Allomyces macrogynus ATCC 38327]|eukprot:KNE58369.1 hypothetical protein AMAG_03952 [Allomyces macrogynus ATCC 38327]